LFLNPEKTILKLSPCMRKILVVHNPTAGDEAQNKADLIAKLKPHAGDVAYVSTDEEGWEDFLVDDVNLIALCGGDGTLRKFAGVMLERNKKHLDIPIYLIPAGTANNIATTLNLGSARDFKFQDDLKNYQLFDFGKISGLTDFDYFLEGVGFGFFPKLILEMNEKEEIPNESADEKLHRTLGVCRNIVERMDPVKVKIKCDGEQIKDKFLLAEVLNTKHIGPNLELAPNGNPGDGFMDLILITPDKRNLLLDYIDHLLSGKEGEVDVHKFVKVIKVKKVKMKSKAQIMHVDDTVIRGENKY